jgi:hypothetical protein
LVEISEVGDAVEFRTTVIDIVTVDGDRYIDSMGYVDAEL